MYTIEITEKIVELTDMALYYHRERFLKMCGACPHYNKLWSCPPYDFEPEALLAQYTYAIIMGLKIVFAAETRTQYADKTSALEFAKQIISGYKRKSDSKMLEMERNYSESMALFSGSCRHCEHCARPLGLPCRSKKYMRPSLESLGYDVVAIADNVMGWPLLWFEDELPPYFTLVTALLLKTKL